VIVKHAIFRCDNNNKVKYMIHWKEDQKEWVEHGSGICILTGPNAIVEFIREHSFSSNGCVSGIMTLNPEKFYQQQYNQQKQNGTRPIYGSLDVLRRAT